MPPSTSLAAMRRGGGGAGGWTRRPVRVKATAAAAAPPSLGCSDGKLGVAPPRTADGESRSDTAVEASPVTSSRPRGLSWWRSSKEDGEDGPVAEVESRRRLRCMPLSTARSCAAPPAAAAFVSSYTPTPTAASFSSVSSVSQFAAGVEAVVAAAASSVSTGTGSVVIGTRGSGINSRRLL